jgi:hypothetical protein
MLVAVPQGGTAAALEVPRTGIGVPMFPVTPQKFLILSVCTLNLYQVYWFYQNWKRLRDGLQQSLSPFWRAFFAILWVLPFLQGVRRRAGEGGVAVPWSAGALALCYVALSLSYRLPEPWWLLALGSGLALLPVVATCQQINEAVSSPEGRNNEYSLANVITIVFGVLFLVVLLVATFGNVPRSPAEGGGALRAERSDATSSSRV